MDKLTTYGATRAKLLTNGYAPCSAVHRDTGWQRIDDPGAILLCPQNVDNALPDATDRQCVALIVTTLDKELRAEVIATLVKFGLANGPCRVASDGSVAYLMRWEGHELALTRNTASLAHGDDPAIVLDCVTRIGDPSQPFLVGTMRIDGEWKGGSPLSVSRSKLPAVESATLGTVWSALDKLVDMRAAPPQEVPQYLREHYEAGVYKRMDFVAPIYESETPPPKSAIRRWYDGITREWVESR
jgi:hypothetical protein